MLLRSGTVVTNNVIYQSPPPSKCSYCNQPGHKINNCKNNERIEKINDELMERTIFSNVIIPYAPIRKKYIRLYLCHLSEINLLMLCYYAKIKKNKNIGMKKKLYKLLLVDYYYELFNIDMNTLTHLLSVISDENYEKYTSEIINNSTSLNLTFAMEEIILDLVYYYRPPQRKFNIQVRTNEESPEESNSPRQDCPICYETFAPAEIIRTACNHHYCKECLTNYFKSLNNRTTPPSCACCREVMTTLYIRNETTRDEIKKKYCNPQQQPQQPHPTTILQRAIFHFVSF